MRIVTFLFAILTALPAYAVNAVEAEAILNQSDDDELVMPVKGQPRGQRGHREGDSCRMASDCGAGMVCAIRSSSTEGVCVDRKAKIK